MTKKSIKDFQKLVWGFYLKNKRDLLWRIEGKRKVLPYHILVSEFMLQQTQVDRVVPKYKEFIELFPTMDALFNAPQKKVISAWIGLGYNRRALFLKKTVEHILKEYKGKIPSDSIALKNLPGIGDYMSNVLPVFIYNQPRVLIETNIRTVFIETFFKDQSSVSDSDILPLIEKTIDIKNPRDWYYALMDYGSYLKKNIKNPNQKSTHYNKAAPFKESKRFVRGALLKYLTKNKSLSFEEIKSLFKNKEAEYLESICDDLIKEQFIKKTKGIFRLR